MTKKADNMNNQMAENGKVQADKQYKNDVGSFKGSVELGALGDKVKQQKWSLTVLTLVRDAKLYELDQKPFNKKRSMTLIRNTMKKDLGVTDVARQTFNVYKYCEKVTRYLEAGFTISTLVKNDGTAIKQPALEDKIDGKKAPATGKGKTPTTRVVANADSLSDKQILEQLKTRCSKPAFAKKASAIVSDALLKLVA